ncbi:MAG: DNA-3-methyladenine glycosylase family protein [Candidatus Dormibacteria bacterium]
MRSAGRDAPSHTRTSAAPTPADHLVAADPAFAAIVAAAPPFELRPATGDPFNALVRSICFQQLAGRAAAAIHGRFQALFTGAPTPAAVLEMGPDALRGAGLSGSKTAAILDLAGRCSDGSVPLAALARQPDDAVVEHLCQVRGIGRWTAEMFLIFELHRPDVWPVDDYGVRNGWARIHGLHEMAPPRAMQSLGDPLRPHRSAAAWYCWRAVDTSLPEPPEPRRD